MGDKQTLEIMLRVFDMLSTEATLEEFGEIVDSQFEGLNSREFPEYKEAIKTRETYLKKVKEEFIKKY